MAGEWVLVVEDRANLLFMLKETLTKAGYQVLGSQSASKALDLLQKNPISIILSDFKMPGMDGMELLSRVREVDPDVPFIMMTAFGTVSDAVRAVKKGATDYLLKPVDADLLFMVFKKALENLQDRREFHLIRQEFARHAGFPKIIGKSAALEEAGKTLCKVAPTDVTVLIDGETGTGKELFARACHQMSKRRERIFLALSCGAIPESLLESELFGYEKGAFTGAAQRQAGKFESGKGGTLFLDEIGEMKIDLQTRLLRVLQEREVMRLGGSKAIPVDVRIIAATNRNLEEMIRGGAFREDLFFRLSVIRIHIPPLRERRDDVPPLTKHFVEKFCRNFSRPLLKIEDAAYDYLCSLPWKGNIRELANCIERAVLLAEGPILRVADFQTGDKTDDSHAAIFEQKINQIEALKELSDWAVEFVEKRKIQRVLAECSGNKSAAARRLQVSYRTLLTKIKEYDLEPHED